MIIIYLSIYLPLSFLISRVFSRGWVNLSIILFMLVIASFSFHSPNVLFYKITLVLLNMIILTRKLTNIQPIENHLLETY